MIFLGYSDDSIDSNSTHNGYVFHHATDSFSLETFILGLVSLTLTLVNILCIIITGVLILRLKEVTPAKVPQKFSHFWRTDVKAHREYYRAIKKGEGKKQEMPGSIGDNEKAPNTGDGAEFLQSIFDRAEEDEDMVILRQFIPTAPTTRVRAPAQGINNVPGGHQYQKVPLGEQSRSRTYNSGYTPVYGVQNQTVRKSFFRQMSTNNPEIVRLNYAHEIEKSEDFRKRVLRTEKGKHVHY